MRLKRISAKTTLPLEKMLSCLESKIAFLKHKQKKAPTGRQRSKIRGRRQLYEKEYFRLQELLSKKSLTN